MKVESNVNTNFTKPCGLQVVGENPANLKGNNIIFNYLTSLATQRQFKNNLMEVILFHAIPLIVF